MASGFVPALLFSLFFSAGGARIRTEAEAEGQLQAGHVLRERYVLQSFVERRPMDRNSEPPRYINGLFSELFGPGVERNRPRQPRQPRPTEAPHGGVPGTRFPKIERRDFAQPEHLGQGSFGDVWSAIDKQTNELVAVKIFHSRGRFVTWTTADYQLQKSLQEDAKECQKIKQLLGSASADPKGASRICNCYGEHISDAKGTSDPVFLVMEMCGQSLTKRFLDVHKRRGTTDLRQARKITRQMLEGLAFLQLFDPVVIHHDLKPDNVVLTDNMDVKIIDWGAMLYARDSAMYSPAVATPLWTPPECQRGRQAFAKPAHSFDVYATGLIHMQLACPAMGYDWAYSVPRSTEDVAYLMRRTCPRLGSHEIQAEAKVIGAMIDQRPSQRPSPTTLLNYVRQRW